MSTIARPFGLLLMWLYELTTNYGVAVILFAIIVKLILLPFQVKSKKSMARTTRLQPQVKALEKQYGSDQQKFNLEVQKLYRENKINPMSGCLWSFLPFPILLALYYAIRLPLTIMMGVPAELLAETGAITARLQSMGFTTTLSSAYQQIAQSQFITANFDKFADLSDKLRQIDFTFLGINMGSQPHWQFLWSTDWSTPAVWGQGLALFIMPIIAAVISYLSSKLASATTAATQSADSAAGSMKTLNYMMPITTLLFGYMMPAAVCLYWIFNMGLSVIQDAILNRIIKRQMADEEAEFLQKMAEKEALLEAKRQRTAQLREENAWGQDKNTSKSKIQKNQKNAQRAKASEWERQHAPEDNSKPENASRVGKRPYARGRNYDPNRYGIRTDLEEVSDDFDDISDDFEDDFE